LEKLPLLVSGQQQEPGLAQRLALPQSVKLQQRQPQQQWQPDKAPLRQLRFWLLLGAVLSPPAVVVWLAAFLPSREQLHHQQQSR